MFGSLINTFLPSAAATKETLGHPAAGVVGWFDSQQNTSGVSVTKDTALTLAAVWCANRIISETLATLPCVLYRTTDDDNRERAKDDQRYFLVHDQPHPSLEPVTYFETSTSHVVMTGNSFTEIARDQRGTPIRLEPRMPENIEIAVSGDNLVYTDTKAKRTIFADDMLHIKGLGGDGISGWSVIKYAQNSIGGGIAGENRANSQFKSGAMPGGALKIPTRLDKAAREQYRREWNEIHEGSEKAGRIAILHGGIEFAPYSMSNEDAQFLQSRKFSIEDVARWFRVPLHMLAHLENSSVRANIEQQAIEFIVYSMGPWLNRWQQAMNRKLLSIEERQAGMYFEFLLASLLRGDVASRYAAYSTARQWGWMSVNDIRRAENMNSIEGGDIYLQPANMMEAGTVPESLQNDMQGNLAASLAVIQDEAAKLRTDIATSHNAVVDVIAGRDQLVRSALDGLREDRQAIRDDIAKLGERTQVQGVDLSSVKLELRELSKAMYQAELGTCVKIEKASAIKAARCQQERGESFLKWLETQYPAFADTIDTRTGEAARIFAQVSPVLIELDKSQAKSPGVRWCETSKAELLAAADGDPSKFVERVQSTIDGWDERVKRAVPV